MNALHVPVSMLLVAALFGGSSATANPTTAPQSYPLVCRGGIFDFVLKPESDTLAFRFKRGAKAASAGVDPGTCAWNDRGVGADEPNSVCQTKILFQYVSAGKEKSYLQATTSVTSYYAKLNDQAWTETFHVYNDGGGCLRVTRVGK